ncbi:hypothetical protein AcW1_002251 [Taiwanofungus camphoratus]|nr:hypothetical protein AcW1_002251 [Antrodia cinnamomea]
MGQNLTIQQKIQLVEKRRKLQMRIDSFESQRLRYMASLMDDNREEWEDEVLPPDQDLGKEWDVTKMDNPFEVPSSQGVNPEVEAKYSSLSLPSTTGVDRCHRAGLQVLLQQEMDLREGQANDALHQIWIAIRQKSFLFRTKVRHAKSQQRKTRAWQDVNTIDKTLQHHARVYSKARKALVLLEAPAGLLAKYQVLHREHLKVSTAVVDPNKRGERGTSLSWFWTMDIQGESDTDSYMQEFYRVNWFRAKSRYDRVVEEEKQLRYEMRFAANYFAHQSEMWVRLMQESTDRDQMGHRAYGAQQASLYLALARDAERLCQWVEQVAHVL